MNEEIGYVLEMISFKTSIYRDKYKRNLSFNDDEYYANLLNDYITNLQQQNQQQKEVIDKAKEYIKQHSNNLAEYLDVYEAKDLLDILKGADDD